MDEAVEKTVVKALCGLLAAILFLIAANTPHPRLLAFWPISRL